MMLVALNVITFFVFYSLNGNFLNEILVAGIENFGPNDKIFFHIRRKFEM